jgi:hypothetical protein
MRLSPSARKLLVSGEPVLGAFWPSSSTAETPGALRWSPSDGATLELFDAGPDDAWPAIRMPVVIHGVLRDGGCVTLLDAWVASIALGDQVRRVQSASLALGAHLDGDERWPRAILRTNGLDQWRRDDTIRPSPEPNANNELHISVGKPSEDEVLVDGARLVFRGLINSTLDEETGLEVRPSQELVIHLDPPLSVEEIRRRHAAPLLTLTHLALNRTDAIRDEIFLDPATQQRAELLHSGREIGPATRRRSLFGAAELTDFPASIQAFWALHSALFPALDLIAEAIGEATFSRGRYLALWTGMEGYCSPRIAKFNIRKVPALTGVSAEATGTTGDAVALLGATRGYLGHLTLKTPYSREIVERQMVDSTRRLMALVQALLLGELLVPPERREALLQEQLKDWPLSGWKVV